MINFQGFEPNSSSQLQQLDLENFSHLNFCSVIRLFSVLESAQFNNFESNQAKAETSKCIFRAVEWDLHSLRGTPEHTYVGNKRGFTKFEHILAKEAPENTWGSRD